jgi:predicted nucleotidyltransferase
MIMLGLDLAQHIASRLSAIQGVEAVVLGGSWARGDVNPNSDLDIGIYYSSQNQPSIEALRQLAAELDDRHTSDVVTDYGEWGPWINGGGWLKIDGQAVDWLYRDLDAVSQQMTECEAGRVRCYYQPGHPHGFYNHIYLGEVFYCQPLYDPNGTLAALKKRTVPYPPLMKKALIDGLWEAGFALDTSRKSADRGEVYYVTGCLFRCVACMIQTLFAINERYCINEKGSLRAADSFPTRPPRFRSIITDVLAAPGNDATSLRRSIERLENLVAQVRELSTLTATA